MFKKTKRINKRLLRELTKNRNNLEEQLLLKKKSK